MNNRLGAIGLAASLAVGLAAYPAAASLATFTFADETGDGATGTLVLQDYAPSAITAANFVSWDFVGALSYHVDAADLVTFSAGFGFDTVGVGGIGDAVEIVSPGFDFSTGITQTPDGAAAWNLSFALNCFPFACSGGDGPQVDNDPPSTYSWTFASEVEPSSPGVPEPLTWTLMIGGLGLAGAQLRVRRRRFA